MALTPPNATRCFQFDRFMKLLIFLVGWCVLLALYWPLAVIVLILAPFVWLISLPLRLVWVCVEALLALLQALLFLPARLLGFRRHP